MPHDNHKGCGCGHNHAHDHQEGCGCGHNHAHDHQEGCGCGHNHKPRPTGPVETTENQKNFLHQLGHHHYLPVARFVIEDSRVEDFSSIALAPVFLRSAADSMETAKEAGAFLRQLEELGLLTLDYDMPLDGYDYPEYKDSSLYQYFCDTVAEAAQRPNFLGNTPVLELGSMGLTPEGQQIADTHCGHTHHHHE